MTRCKLCIVISVAAFFIMGLFSLSFVNNASAAKGVRLVIHESGSSRSSTKAWEWWAKEVEKETKGEVTFEILFGGPFGGPKEALDSLKNNVYDVTGVPVSYAASKIPLWTAFGVPFVTSSMWAYNMTMLELMDDPVLKKQFEQWNVKPLIARSFTSFEIMSKKPCRNLADLKGLKIRSYGMMAEVLKHFGAVTISMSSHDTFENMQRGVIDAVTMPWPDLFINYGIHELSDYALVLGGFGFLPGPFCISMDSWNKIPLENQKIMLKLARKATEKNIEMAMQSAAPALAKIKAKGIEVNHLSKAEREQMVAVAKKIWESWVEKQVKAGRPEARSVMDTIIRTAKEYEAKDPYK